MSTQKLCPLCDQAFKVKEAELRITSEEDEIVSIKIDAEAFFGLFEFPIELTHQKRRGVQYEVKQITSDKDKD